MKEKTKKITIYIIAALIIILGAMVVIKGLSQEDDWMCVNGQWVKHGQPRAAMPTTACEK